MLLSGQDVVIVDKRRADCQSACSPASLQVLLGNGDADG